MSALEWGQVRCHCSVYQKIQDHLDGKSQYCFPAHKVSTSVQTEGVQTDASSQTDAMVETDILQENMKYESDVESNVESDVDSDLESDVTSEGLVEPSSSGSRDGRQPIYVVDAVPNS